MTPVAEGRWRPAWLAVAALAVLQPSTAFREEFDGDPILAPAMLLRPHVTSIGTPLWKGTMMIAQLDLVVEARGPLHGDVPVQLAVWSEEELDQMQAQATPLPTSRDFALDPDTFCELCSASLTPAPSSNTSTNATSPLCLANPPASPRVQTFWVRANRTHRVWSNLTIEHHGAYYLSLSSCAGGASGDLALRLSAEGFVQWLRPDGGNLPGGLLGIVPFYGGLSFVYVLLSVVWTWRMRKFWGYTITLQLTVFVIMLANLLYTILAFGYYLHLDLDTSANSHQVFGGVYAGIYQFNDPFAVVVASYRFALVSSCQVLLTLLCDGLFVLRPLLRVRVRTKAFVVWLILAEFLLLVLQRPLYFVTVWLHAVLQMGVVVLWLVWLGYTSWATWLSLYAEDDHVGWSTPLKQRVYKAVCRAVFMYPVLTSLVYALFFVFVKSWQWMWLRMVVFDVWMLIVMLPASWYWMPHSTSAQYAPLMEEMPAAARVMEMAAVALDRDAPRSLRGLSSHMDGGTGTGGEDELGDEDELGGEDESEQMIV